MSGAGVPLRNGETRFVTHTPPTHTPTSSQLRAACASLAPLARREAAQPGGNRSRNGTAAVGGGGSLVAPSGSAFCRGLPSGGERCLAVRGGRGTGGRRAGEGCCLSWAGEVRQNLALVFGVFLLSSTSLLGN